MYDGSKPSTISLLAQIDAMNVKSPFPSLYGLASITKKTRVHRFGKGLRRGKKTIGTFASKKYLGLQRDPTQLPQETPVGIFGSFVLCTLHFGELESADVAYSRPSNHPPLTRSPQMSHLAPPCPTRPRCRSGHSYSTFSWISRNVHRRGPCSTTMTCHRVLFSQPLARTNYNYGMQNRDLL